MLTATQIIDQAMQAAGNTDIQSWCLTYLNTVLREIYRKYEWPFLIVNDESLSTTASQAYTSYATLSSLWKPRVIQIRNGTTLYEVRTLPGGLAAYFADTSRLSSSGRPSKYIVDRRNSRIYWADSIPSAAETISLTYQTEESNVALGDEPKLATHTKNGEQYLILRLTMDIKAIYMGEVAEGSALASLVREKLDAMLSERLDDSDSTPTEHGNRPYA